MARPIRGGGENFFAALLTKTSTFSVKYKLLDDLVSCILKAAAR